MICAFLLLQSKLDQVDKQHIRRLRDDDCFVFRGSFATSVNAADPEASVLCLLQHVVPRSAFLAKAWAALLAPSVPLPCISAPATAPCFVWMPTLKRFLRSGDPHQKSSGERQSPVPPVLDYHLLLHWKVLMRWNFLLSTCHSPGYFSLCQSWITLNACLLDYITLSS